MEGQLHSMQRMTLITILPTFHTSRVSLDNEHEENKNSQADRRL